MSEISRVFQYFSLTLPWLENAFPFSRFSSPSKNPLELDDKTTWCHTPIANQLQHDPSMAALPIIAKQNLSAEDRQTCIPPYSQNILPPANEDAERLCVHRCLFMEGERVGTPHGRVPPLPTQTLDQRTYPPPQTLDLGCNSPPQTYPLSLATDILWSSLEICSNLFTWGPTTLPLVLTSSGGHWNTYSWQVDGTHPTVMLSFIFWFYIGGSKRVRGGELEMCPLSVQFL